MRQARNALERKRLRLERSRYNKAAFIQPASEAACAPVSLQSLALRSPPVERIVFGRSQIGGV